MLRKIANILFIVLAITGCTNNATTEKHQTVRNKIENCYQKVKEFQTGDILIGSTTRLYSMDNHLIIADHKSSNQLIHIFNMQDFTYVQSIGELGQGPGEITILGNIGIDNIRKNLYISDYGKQKIFSYNVDSAFANPFYMPNVKMEMDKGIFPDVYQFFSDTLAIGRMISPTSSSSFKQMLARLNMQTGKILPLKENHPEIEKKRVCFTASETKNICVECYTGYDLMVITDIMGNLKYNIYGPEWKENLTATHYYSKVALAKDKIIASYSGGNKRTDDYYPTKFFVFDIEGNYLKTLDINRKITDFCYDDNSNRIIMSFNDDIQFGYLELNGLI